MFRESYQVKGIVKSVSGCRVELTISNYDVTVDVMSKMEMPKVGQKVVFFIDKFDSNGLMDASSWKNLD